MQKVTKGKGVTQKDAEVTGQDCSWILCSDSKSPPISWLNRLLTKITPDHKNKYVCMDLGRKLGRNVEVKKLLMKHGYNVRPTGPSASHQNSPGKRPHETIGVAV
eukprot:9406385-Ditylum_brightwellii.AAC.1